MNHYNYKAMMEIIKHRRSVRKFEPGKSVQRETLLKIAEAGRWAPSGANTQPWDLLIVDDPDMKKEVLGVFTRQAQRLVDHARGFPAVMKTYLKDTVAIFIVVADPRWKICFPQASSLSHTSEYGDNNENIYLASIGAAIQNIQLGVTAVGLTSAWLSGGGEQQTNNDLCELLGYPPFMQAIGTIPIGYPRKEVSLRYRRPLEQLVHWNKYQPEQFRPDEMIQYYEDKLRPFAMYRHSENMQDWEDFQDKTGRWDRAFTSRTTHACAEDPKDRGK